VTEEALTAFAVLAGYASIGTLFFSFFGKDEDDVVMAVIWPAPVLATAIVGPLYGVWWLGQKAKTLKLPSRQSKALAYAEAPLSILAAMVAQRIIANPNCFNYRDEWISDKIKVICNSHLDDFRSITVDDKTFTYYDFKDSDKKVIRKALEQATKLNNERKAAEAAAKLNNSALDVIEKLAAVPVASSLLSPEK
jgi:hypothetical protein